MSKRFVSILAVSALACAAALTSTVGSLASAAGSPAAVGRAATKPVTSSSLGNYSPTFVGPAATGCAKDCSLLRGPYHSPSTAALSPRAVSAASSARPEALPSAMLPRLRHGSGASTRAAVTIPAVSCAPLGPGCDSISSSSGGATGVKGLNAVDSASQSTNTLQQDIEPADQGVCAGKGYAVESNNLGEILVFNRALHRKSSVIPLDTVMDLTKRGWSSGGDISCVYDYGNGGHWIFTEIVSTSPESKGGPFAGCFAAKPHACYEGIAVTVGSNPFGPYNVYFLNADYNPSEAGSPYLLNDFAKIATSRDAFLLFYDEFPLNGNAPGFGGGFFNGAQELAFNKNALERGLPVREHNGSPNPAFTVARENMGLLKTPNGTCFSDSKYHLPGLTCWYSVIPVNPPDPTQYDNSHGGSGFMLDTLDYYGLGDNRLAVFDWTGLDNLNSSGCSRCSGIHFGGQLFSGVQPYYEEGALASQKVGPIPLGDECGAAKLSVGSPPPASCPEGGIATNGDNFTEASQAQGQLWGAISTEVDQTYASSTEMHIGAAYWVVGTASFDKSGNFSLTRQGYASAAHEDLEFPTIAAEGNSSQDGGNGRAIMAFSLSGNGGPSVGDLGGYYPSTAYGRLTSSSNGLVGSAVNIADLGQAPEDGFAEYQGYPGTTRPRWGDYGAAVFLPWSGGRIYFATNYIQYPNCTGKAFALKVGTCGGTRDGFANWGTSVNFVVP